MIWPNSIGSKRLKTATEPAKTDSPKRTKPINSRAKGKAGELEVAALLRDALGVDATRNLVQSREGGADLLGLPGWAVEVKRAKESSQIAQWWDQACRQAERSGCRPVLFYRLDRRKWQVVVALRHFKEEFKNAPMWMYLEMGFDVFAALIREEMNSTQPEEDRQ